MIKQIIVSLALVLTAGIALANEEAPAFIHSDWKQDGDGLTTIQVEAGLEWLKLTETAGWSLTDIYAEMGAGGEFEGWRLPTAQEMDNYWHTMFTGSSVLTQMSQGGQRTYGGYPLMARNFVEFSGRITPSPIRSYGIGRALNGEMAFWGLSRVSTGTTYRYAFNRGGYDDDFSSPFFGYFLVAGSAAIPGNGQNISDVGSPLLVGMLGLGLFALGRKKSLR